jgi:hypothetical protein
MIWWKDLCKILWYTFSSGPSDEELKGKGVTQGGIPDRSKSVLESQWCNGVPIRLSDNEFIELKSLTKSS